MEKKSLSYYLHESPLAKGKFLARTVLNSIYSDEKLIDEMIRNNPGRKTNDIKEFFKEMVKAAEDLMSEGNGISIPNFLKISPSVKGSFDSDNDFFVPSKNWVDINCTVSSAFISDFQKKITLEKTDKLNNFPLISSVCDTKTKESVIQHNYPNLIRGNYLLVAGYEIEGLTIISKADNTKSVTVKNDKELHVVHLKTKEMMFNFKKSFKAPEWLEEGSGILIKLTYLPQDMDANTESKDMNVSCKPFETKWSCIE